MAVMPKNVCEQRIYSARSGLDQLRARTQGTDEPLPPGLAVTVFGDLIGAIADLAAQIPEDHLELHVGKPKRVDSDFVTSIENERAEQHRLKAEAFDRIAAFVGVAGINASASPAQLFHEVGNLVATVKGVPNPNVDDTNAHYLRIAPGVLTKRQRRLVGLGGTK